MNCPYCLPFFQEKIPTPCKHVMVKIMIAFHSSNRVQNHYHSNSGPFPPYKCEGCGYEEAREA